MKNILILSCILLLIGCSQKEINVDEYEGNFGTYKLMETHLISDTELLREEYVQLRWKIKYTNTTSEPRKPNESVKLDMVIEHETDIELNEIPFNELIYSEENQLAEEKELIANGELNIKPGATVEIIVGSVLQKENISPLFLRNRNEQGKNGTQFEKEIKTEKIDNTEEVDIKFLDKPLVVNVHANQDSWEFSYPSTEIILSNELIVPTNEKVYFNIMPSNFGHSFWIPSVGGMVSASTDKINEFYLEFDSESANESGGVFQGKCGEHKEGMDFTVKAIPRTEFNQWIKEMTEE